MDKHEAKVALNSNRAAQTTTPWVNRAGEQVIPNTRGTAEAWLEGLGTSMCDVWFLQKGSFFLEKHVEDHETFLETVGMALDRLMARYAMWEQGGDKPWALLDKTTGDTRSFPSREAAEMVAIHGG